MEVALSLIDAGINSLQDRILIDNILVIFNKQQHNTLLNSNYGKLVILT